ETIANRGGETTRLRHGKVARVGAGARHDVARQLGTRLRHADVVQPVVQRTQISFLQIAQRKVLPVGETHVEVEVALDVGERTELLDGDVADAGIRHRADRALRNTTYDIRLHPTVVRITRQELDVRVDANLGCVGGAAGGRVAALLHDVGNATRPVARAAQ